MSSSPSHSTQLHLLINSSNTVLPPTALGVHPCVLTTNSFIHSPPQFPIQSLFSCHSLLLPLNTALSNYPTNTTLLTQIHAFLHPSSQTVLRLLCLSTLLPISSSVNIGTGVLQVQLSLLRRKLMLCLVSQAVTHHCSHLPRTLI